MAQRLDALDSGSNYNFGDKALAMFPQDKYLRNLQRKRK